MTEEIEKLCRECEEANVCSDFLDPAIIRRTLRSCVSALREMDAQWERFKEQWILLEGTYRDACTRAEKAEAELAELRPENAHWQKILSKATENL